jgi:large subunit ribosomal protein L25
MPAVIYGRTGQTRSIDLEASAFVSNTKNISKSTILTIKIDNETHEVFIKETQRSILTGNILHVDFYEVESGLALRTKVELRVHGNPIGVREGGILELPIHEIEVECLPKDLPERIDVDVSELGVNQSIHVRDLALSEAVRVISGLEQVVALVKFAKAESESAASEATASTETETKS